MKEEHISFSFGENWKNFLGQVDEDDIQRAKKDILDWLGPDAVKGKRVIDIGSGSGIHSFIFYSMGAKELISFDYDINSVEATKRMWERAGKPDNWKVMQGSALDVNFIKSLGEFDVVYSWGVLHHTGEMWKAIENSCLTINAQGTYWISIYKKGPRYEADLSLKRRYNKASALGKRMMVSRNILRRMIRLLRKGKNPFKWNKKVGRGMHVYNDIIDWYGGLPYEVASKEEIVQFCSPKGLSLEMAHEAGEGGCSVYLFKKK